MPASAQSKPSQGRLHRTFRRGAVGREPAPVGCQGAPGRRLAAAEDAPVDCWCRRTSRHARSRLRPAGRTRRGRPRSLRTPRGGGSARARCRQAGARCSAKRSGSWRGPPLDDLAYEDFAQPAIAHLEQERLAALEERIDADLEAGQDAALVGELEELVARHPLRERLRGQLMLALYRSGRQADALGAYQDARRTLVDELGIEPGPELQRSPEGRAGTRSDAGRGPKAARPRAIFGAMRTDGASGSSPGSASSSSRGPRCVPPDAGRRLRPGGRATERGCFDRPRLERGHRGDSRG